jgi:large repetitive protein
MDFETFTTPMSADNDPTENAAGLARGNVAAVAGAGAQRVVPTNGVVVLPDGVTLDAITVSGRDIIVQLPGGQQLVIVDGAITMPQLVIGAVQVPAANLAALLIGQEPQPAAGPPQSSGGNFAQAPGNIGDPFGLGNLLPPTQLAFPEQKGREIIPNKPDRPASIKFVSGNQLPGTNNAVDQVDEAALPARGTEPAGSSPSSNAETITGTLVYSAPDGLASLTINGTPITSVGQTITTPFGVLTITRITPANIGYSYTLTDNTTAATPSDVFVAVVRDTDGDTSTATLTINITDDVPTARADTDGVSAGSYAPESGNVVTGVGTTSGTAGADTPGADGAAVSGFRAGNSGAFAAVGTTIAGQYGTLTLGANGGYTYTRNPGSPGGVADVFSYQLTDGDGDTSTATLTINIADGAPLITSIPTVGEGTIVSEVGLPARGTEPAGTDPESTVEATSGTITFVGGDGPATVQIGGVTVTGPGQVITTPSGTLTITSVAAGSIGYLFVLTDNTLGDPTSVTLQVTVTDVDGDSVTSPLTITIIDDVPTARNDAATATEDQPLIITALTNDTPGADGVNLATGVVVATGPAKGSVVYNNDGSFTYTPTPGADGTDSFTYTITDGDGDTSTATVTITLAPDSVPTLSLSGDTTVDESGLPARGSEPAGSDAASTNEIATGTIAVSTGTDSLASLVVGGVSVTGGGTVTTSSGTLVVALSGGAYTYTYTLTDNTSGNATTDSFVVVATDSDGDSVSNTLVIAIADDVPTAIADTDAIAAGTYGPATGNVITDVEADGGKDTPGADGVTVSAFAAGATAGTLGSALAGTYGQLTLNGDGSYSYVRNPGTPGGVSDVFSYTVTDGDGDTSTATLTISIADSPTSLSLPTRGAAGTIVNEAGLPSGSDAASTSETTAGTISYVAPDGPATVTIDGVAVATVGQTFVGATGTLTITSIASGAIGYSYTLTTNTLGDATFEDFAIVVTDQDGDTTPGTLIIDIVDDVPTARADVDAVTEDDFGGTNEVPTADGNVLTGSGGTDANATDGVSDTRGADGAAVTAVAFGGSAGSVGGVTGGTYGTLTLGADGSYSYVLDNANGAVQGLDSNDTLTEVFTYQITDGDGDVSSTTLTITINGADDGVTITGLNGEGAEEVVFENDLTDGSSPDAAALTQTGSFSLLAVDGVTTVTVGGQTIFDGAFVPGVAIANAYGTLTITGFTPNTGADGSVIGGSVTYSYVLADNTLLHTGANDSGLTESFAVVVTDTDGTTATDSLDVRIIDDVPAAAADTGNVTEGATLNVAATGVLGNDVLGADGGVIAGIRAAGGDTTTAVNAGVGGAIVGQFGTLTLAADGGYTYVSNANSVAPGGAVDIFVYTIRDGDGDLSTTTLTIDLVDAGLAARGDDVAVNEAALATGSDPSSPAETVTGTLADNVSGGNGPFSFALVGSGTGTNGTLTLGANGSYSYTLTAPVDGPTADNGTNTFNNVETFTYAVTDANGNTVQNTITIDVIDDVPTAVADLAIIVAEDAIGTVGGNLLSNDTPGADGATLTSVTIGSATTVIAAIGSTTVSTANGTYLFDATGAWTFDPNSNLNNASAVDAGFSYVITDGDGDTSSALQGITITDGAPPVAGVPITLALDDQNLADGSTPAGPDSASGNIVFTPGSDAITSIVFGASVAGLGGSLTWLRVSDTQITGSAGAVTIVTLDLSVTGPSATVTATLNDNYALHPGVNLDDLVNLGTVSVVATDIDGDTATGTVNVTISDDLPTITATNPVAGALTVDETDLTTNATASFASLFSSDANADGPGSTSFALAATAGPSGLIDVATGAAVNLAVVAGVVEGRTAGGDLVFTVAVDGATGAVTLDQIRAVTHANATDPNDAATLLAANLVRLVATVTDADGDTAQATANIGGALLFRDDGPAIDASVVDGNSVLLTTHDALTIGAASDTATTTASFGGAFTIATSSYGADNAGTTVWSYALSVGNAASGLASNGVAISLSIVAGVVEGRAGADLIFTVSVNSATGAVTLTQLAEIDHAPEVPSGAPFDDQLAILGNGLVSLNGTATITDRDGDQATETVSLDLGGNIRFADHGPTASVGGEAPLLLVDETNLLTNATENLSSLFTTPLDFGADGAGSVAYALGVVGGPSGLVDTLTGSAVNLSLNGTTVEGRTSGGLLVFSVSVNAATGAVTLDQARAVVHSPNVDANDVTSLVANLVTLTQTVTDGDGDTATATANIGGMLLFRDDGPSAGANDAVLLDDDALGGNPGGTGDVSPDTENTSGILNHTFGSDGGTMAFQTTGAPAGFSYVLSGNNLLISQGATLVITVTLNPSTGAYTVTQNAPINHALGDNENGQKFVVPYLVTDGDNDTASSSILISVNDDTPISVAGSSVGVVDEEGLSGGNAGGTGDVPGQTPSASGSVTSLFAAGADAPLTYSLVTDTGSLPALTSGGVAVTYGVVGNVLTASAGANTVFTFTLNAVTGAWDFVLVRPLDHPVAGTEDDITIQLGSLVQATDKDGDSVVATGNVTITVDDDTPLAADDTDAVTEDIALIATGNVLSGVGSDGDVAGKDEPGADGAAAGGAVTAIAGGTIGVDLVGSYGTIKLAADGSYTYTLNNALVAVQGLDSGEKLFDTFTYTITDRDGDSTTAVIKITIDGTNDAPLVGTGTAVVSEEGLTGGIIDSVGSPTDTTNLAVATGTISITDVDGEPSTVTLGNPGAVLTADGLPVTWTGAGTGTLIGFVGAVEVIRVAITNAGAYTVTLSQSVDHPTINVEDLKTFVVPVSVSDGTVTVPTTLTITIEDDSPIAANDSITTIEGAPAITGNVLSNDQIGADTPGALVSVNGGAPGVIVGSFGSLTISATGAYTYTPNASVPSGSIDSFTYIMRDADGDTSPAVLKFTFSGDANLPSGGTATASVDDDALSGGIANGTGDLPDANADGDNNQATFSGTLGFNFGLDGAGTVGFAALGGTTGTVGTETVNYAWNAGTNTLTATGPRGALFTVQVTNVVTGAYKVTLLDNVLHAAGGAENDATAALNYTVTDSDGSSTTGTLTITFDDDTPTLGIIQNGTANNLPASATSVGTLHFSPGADGVGAVGAISLTTAGLTSGGKNIVTQQVGNVLTGYADVDSSGTFNAGDTSVFTLTVNPGAATSGQYVFDLTAPLDGATTNTPIGGTTSFGAGPAPYQVVSATNVAVDPLAIISGWQTNGSFNAAAWYAGSATLPVVGVTFASINGSTAGWGVDNNSFAAGELIRWDFGAPLDDFDGAGGYTPPATVLPAISYASFEFIGYTGADSIQFVVHYTDGTTSHATVTGAALAAPLTLTAPAGKFIDWIDTYTPNAGPGKIDITAVGVQETFVDRTLGFSVVLNDGDSDPLTGTFSVNVKDGNTPSTPVAPIALDLDGNGVQYLSTIAGVTFDYNGDGSAVRTAWVAANDGLLAIDSNGDGRVNNGSEIVFGQNGQTDLQGLAAQYDSNHDGQLSAADADFAKFGVWQDANSNGVSDAGEFQTLADAGIVSISLTSDGVASVAENGDVDILGQSTYIRADGTTGIVADVAFATGGESVPARTAANDDQRALASASLAGMTGAVAAAGMIVSSTLAAADVADAPLSDAGTIDLGQLVPVVVETETKHEHRGETASPLGEAVDQNEAAHTDAPAPSHIEHESAHDAHTESASFQMLSDLLDSTDISPANITPAPAAHDFGAIAAAMPQLGAAQHVASVVADALSADSVGQSDIDAVIDAFAPHQGDLAVASDAGIAGLILDQGAGFVFTPTGMPDFGHDLALAQAQLEMAATNHA